MIPRRHDIWERVGTNGPRRHTPDLLGAGGYGLANRDAQDKHGQARGGPSLYGCSEGPVSPGCRCSRQKIKSPATMMIAAPQSVKASGTSLNTRKPSTIAQRMIVYCYGTTTLAAASLSERLTQASAQIENTPNSDIKAKSRSDGLTQAMGATAPPNSKVPSSCPATSTVFDVSRNCRVTIMSSAKNTLPTRAMQAGSVKVAAEGRNAISTPRNPISTAVQRHQPTS